MIGPVSRLAYSSFLLGEQQDYERQVGMSVVVL